MRNKGHGGVICSGVVTGTDAASNSMAGIVGHRERAGGEGSIVNEITECRTDTVTMFCMRKDNLLDQASYSE